VSAALVVVALAEGARRDAVAAPKSLDEMRRLSVADQPGDVGDRQRLVGEQLGRVPQSHRAQLGGEARQADLVVGPLKLTWGRGQRSSER
jgi:hypothetical protein